MLLNAGARHDGAAKLANSKFDALWDMILASASREAEWGKNA